MFYFTCNRSFTHSTGSRQCRVPKRVRRVVGSLHVEKYVSYFVGVRARHPRSISVRRRSLPVLEVVVLSRRWRFPRHPRSTAVSFGRHSAVPGSPLGGELALGLHGHTGVDDGVDDKVERQFEELDDGHERHAEVKTESPTDIGEV